MRTIKRFVCIVLALLVVSVSFSGCGNSSLDLEDPEGERFIRVYYQGEYAHHTKVYVDTYTGVMYLYNREYNSGGLTVMYNNDGSILTYEQYLEKGR